MTLEQDWERLTKAFLKLKTECPAGSDMFIFAHICDLRKADNKSIDFAIRRLMADPEYSKRIELHGGPLYPRYPLRVTHRRPFTGVMEYRYIIVEIPELRRREDGISQPDSDYIVPKEGRLIDWANIILGNKKNKEEAR